MIYYISPYDTEKRYGRALNEHIKLLPPDAWICVRDGDTAWLTDDWGRVLEEAIRDNPTAHLMTCSTNRSWGQKLDPETDIVKLREKALGRPKNYKKMSSLAPAHMWLFPKSTWLYNPFDQHPILHGFDSFDTRWCRGLRGPVIKIDHLMIFHYYRLHKDHTDYKHLK